ncbi:transmembrane protein 150C [Poecilia latipinna]|uniref:transmembrane protein 150C n=1 Tax=Poecilia latipinna TaxID=48699 RepID=UPI00072E2819|nr:PREDICTED: transmembrane protein 150C-like [Poecilia latipinna]XP_014913587.1 PREDICTED: transmembrane protein 150C-like [Poecilia latipinna]XP_014913588.1 PREDICTED: transmembrane protein 150C-like [Poecilia latipinna]
MWWCRPLVLLPPILSTFTAAGLWVVYFIARHNGKVLPLTSAYRKGNGSAYPPYISFTGNFPPASCYFSEILNLTAFAAFVVGILRYFQVKTKLDKRWLNIFSLVCFSVACFGMTIVGNFQLLEMWVIHNGGTLLAFGLGNLYCWLQSYITWKVNLNNQGKVFAIGRVVLSAAITFCIILQRVLVVIPHMHTVRCQWAVVMLFLIYISTFAIDFRHCRFEVVCRDTVERKDCREDPDGYPDGKELEPEL